MTSTSGLGDETHVRYLASFREHWRLIVVLVLVATLSAGAYSYAAQKRYEAHADLLVSPATDVAPSVLGLNLFQQSSDPARNVLTMARLVKTPEAAAAAGRKLGLTPSEVLQAITVTPLSQSDILTIQATDSSSGEAAAIANAFADAVVAERTATFQQAVASSIRRLRAQLDAIPAVDRNAAEGVAIQQQIAGLAALVGTSDPTLQIVNRASPPSSPSWPRPKLSIGLAFLAALLLGSGAAIALEFLSPTLTREEDLLTVYPLPILTRVPRLPRSELQGYLTGRGPLPVQAWESYRILRASIATAGPDGHFPRSVLVTSAIPREGKTLTAVNLALTMALAGMRVILVDGDLRRPMVAGIFGVATSRNGFPEVLAGTVPVERAVVPAPNQATELQLLLTGPGRSHVVDLLDTNHVEHVMSQLQEAADIVIIDSPPLAEVADALPLADAVDGVIVAVRMGHSRRDKLTEIRRVLTQRGVHPLGIVLTQRERATPEGYGGYKPVAPDLETKVTSLNKVSRDVDLARQGVPVPESPSDPRIRQVEERT